MILSLVGSVLDKILPDANQRNEAKLKLLEMQQSGELARLQAASSVVTAEAKSEHWLTANWRPITMLSFVALIVAHWLGFTADGLTEAQVLSLLEIVKVGLGGYVIGRSAEKCVKGYSVKK